MSRYSCGMRFWSNVYRNFFHTYDKPNLIPDFDKLFQDHPVYYKSFLFANKMSAYDNCFS